MFDFHDFSGDGRLDVLLSAGRTNVVWLERPAEEGLDWKLHRIGTMEPDSSTGLTLADIDADGDPDIYCGSYSGPPRDRDGEDVTAESALGRLAWFQNPGAAGGEWKRHDITRRKRGMFDMAVAKDMDGDGDLDFVGTRGNSLPYDGVYWLEQVRTETPQPAFVRARAEDSEEMPLP